MASECYNWWNMMGKGTPQFTPGQCTFFAPGKLALSEALGWVIVVVGAAPPPTRPSLHKRMKSSAASRRSRRVRRDTRAQLPSGALLQRRQASWRCPPQAGGDA
jgi:hypothetical protein